MRNDFASLLLVSVLAASGPELIQAVRRVASAIAAPVKPVRNPLAPPVRPAALPALHCPCVTLAWEPVDVAMGYRLYYGSSSGAYTNSMDVGATLQASVSNLVVGNFYYFAVTDYDTNRLESDFSTEVSYFVASIPPVTNWLVSVEVQDSTNGLNWQVLTNLPAVGLTNPPGDQLFFRALMGITNQ